ncbi:2Fe-2S iron-sulfur cluster-binding protein [Streptomyces sp. NPDC003393]
MPTPPARTPTPVTTTAGSPAPRTADTRPPSGSSAGTDSARRRGRGTPTTCAGSRTGGCTTCGCRRRSGRCGRRRSTSTSRWTRSARREWRACPP